MWSMSRDDLPVAEDDSNGGSLACYQDAADIGILKIACLVTFSYYTLMNSDIIHVSGNLPCDRKLHCTRT